MTNLTRKLITLLALAIILSACGGGGGGGNNPSLPDGQNPDSPAPDAPPTAPPANNGAPLASILFPPPGSLTTSPTVTLRGSALDLEGDSISSVTVNGVAASSNDGFATWQVSVPLSLGDNRLQVSTRDNTNNVAVTAASAEILFRQPDFVSPADVVVDRVGNRALVVDSAANTLSAVDLTTGIRTVLSGPDFSNDNALVGSGPQFQFATELTLDLANNRAFVSDLALDSVFEVDLGSGDRTVVAGVDPDNGNTPVGTGTNIRLSRAVEYDAVNNRLWLLDASLEAILIIDLNTRTRTVLSDINNGSGVAFADPKDFSLDLSNNRLLVVDSDNRRTSVPFLVGVDLTSGDRTVVSGIDPNNGNAPVGIGPDFVRPQSVYVDSGNNRAFVVEARDSTLFEVNLSNGTRIQLVGAGPAIQAPAALELDASNNRLILVDSDIGLMFADLSTGTRGLLGKQTGRFDFFDSGANTQRLRSLQLDRSNNRALAVDNIGDTLFAVDLTNGERSEFSGINNGSGAAFTRLNTLLIDESNNRILGADQQDDSIYSIELASGDRSQLFTNASGNGPTFNFIQDLALDPDRNQLLVLDNSRGALFAINFGSGNRTVLSGNIPDSSNLLVGNGPDFSNSQALQFEASTRVVWVADSGLHALLRVDPESGDRTVVSGNNPEAGNALVGTGPSFVDPVSIVLDDSSNQILVVDSTIDVIFSVNKSSGDRTVISGVNPTDGLLIGAGPALDQPSEGVLGIDNNLLFILNGGDGVMVVDLLTGERVLISDGPFLNGGKFGV